jgi:D-sedoheptulose 7-phosphate isomerase
MDLNAIVNRHFEDHCRVANRTQELLSERIADASLLITRQLISERRILACGNSAGTGDAQGFVASMLNRFEMERTGLPAISLNTDAAIFTSIANDYQYTEIYAKQIRALGQQGDVLLAITNTGESANIVAALDAAHERGMHVILLSGRDGGKSAAALLPDDIELRVPPCSTPRTREVHRIIIHCLCDLIDRQLFGYED